MSNKPKPSPKTVIEYLEICADPFAGCDGCAFGPCDCPDCRDNLMLAAAEYLREEFIPEGEWVEESRGKVYRCPACGARHVIEIKAMERLEYRLGRCFVCEKRLSAPK